ncbi:MAG: hypothetical protein JWN30_986 [Bacilli bacterium]|nr:hypothetical protein [Bacilli bacterium]
MTGVICILDRVNTLLNEDLFANISLLKMIDTYGEGINFRLSEQDSVWALLLILPTSRSSFDSSLYPDTEAVVYMSCSHPQHLNEVLKELPNNKKYIFKVQKPEYASILGNFFRLQRKRGFNSYTTNEHFLYSYDHDVVEEASFNGRLKPLWAENGHDLEEINYYFNKGARSFTMYQANAVISTCLIFPNYKHIWELGAVYTLETMRGKGYARRVVTSALSRLLEMNLIPRYQVVDTNRASIKLAESIELKRFMVLEHLINL